MFDPEVLSKLAVQHGSALKKLVDIEDCLNKRFVESERAIRALILSVASGEPLLLVGPTGTGKSRLIRAFCGLIGLLDENDLSQNHPGYFEYLLTPFTEPGELFGYYDPSQALNEGKLQRLDQGMMQTAKVVYLDEIFNGSSAILNSILAFLNERIFHDRGIRVKVAMQCLFSATNQIPEAPELRAVFDRFVLRCMVDNIEARPEPISDLLKVGWPETYGQRQKNHAFSGLLDEMTDFRQKIIALTAKGELLPLPNHPVYKCLAQLVTHARQYGLSDMSNRRLVKLTHIMLVHSIYNAVRQNRAKGKVSLGADELQLLPRYFLDHVDEEVVQKMERPIAECLRNSEFS